MYRRHPVSWFGALLLAICGIASAQNAYTARPMNVRAGPNRNYPLVAQVDAGTPLDLHGCLNGWSWCDVSFDGNRGWMYGGGIDFQSNGGNVPLYTYGPQVGLPIITFSLGAYWGQYYQGRPWYAQRNTWAHRNFPPPGRLPRPAGRPQPGPGARPTTHSRPSAPARSGGQMQGHAAPAGRGPPKGGHAQRPPSSSHGGNEHGGGDQQHGGDQQRNPP